MTTVAERPQQAAVHLRLRGPIGDAELATLRQQLATCLHSGVNDIRMHVDEQEDLPLPVLQALHGVACYLHRHGGALSVVGARPRVRRKIRVNELHLLLPEPEPARQAVGTGPAASARHA